MGNIVIIIVCSGLKEIRDSVIIDAVDDFDYIWGSK